MENLMKRLATLITQNPILGKALEAFCTACEQNPELANKLCKSLGNFTMSLAKAYVKDVILQATHSQTR